MLAAAVATLAVLVMAPAPAAARTAAPDPVRALKKQLKAERGVKLTELSQSGSGLTFTRLRIKSSVQLSPSGPVAAYSLVEEVDDGGGSTEVLGFPRAIYLGGEDLAELLSRGKSWVGFEGLEESTVNTTAYATEQQIHVFDPAVLKALLKGKRAEPVSGGYSYQGVVTFEELYEASKSYYADKFRGLKRGGLAKMKISWRLWTDREGLIQRLRAKESLGTGKHRYVNTADTRFSDWGHTLTLSPPAEDEVLLFDDLDQIEIPEPGLRADGAPGLR